MPRPMSASASRTLTAAMMPSSRFVVASSPAMSTSEWRCLVRRRVARRLRTAFAERLVQELPAFVGHASRLLHRGPEAHELACELVERRLDFAPDRAAPVRKEEVARKTPDDRADNRGCHCPRVVHPPSYPLLESYKLCATRDTCGTARARPNAHAEPVSFRYWCGWAYVAAGVAALADAELRDDLPASRMSCFFILL